MCYNKLGGSLYIRPEHRRHKSALLSPSVNVSTWDDHLNRISPKHFYGDMRLLAWFIVPLNKIALLHYYHNSDRRHHKFTLMNGCNVHVSRIGYDDSNVRFHTYFTGTSDSDYADEHMQLDMNLIQIQALVVGFSSREGFMCVKCKDPDSLILSFKHMTKTKDELEDAHIVDELWEIMNGFNGQLRHLKCKISTRTCRIEAEVDFNNLYAGPICFVEEMRLEMRLQELFSQQNKIMMLDYLYLSAIKERLKMTIISLTLTWLSFKKMLKLKVKSERMEWRKKCLMLTIIKVKRSIQQGIYG